MTMFLERLRVHRDEMTARERQIAGYLEAGYPHAGLESATALGERLTVSAATVVRFIAKLGYDGYAEFQREARDEVEARLASPLQRLERQAPPQQPAQGGADIATHSLEAALAAVTRTFGAIDRRVLDGVVAVITGCRGRIWVMGEKKGRSIALYLYSQLNLAVDRVSLLDTDASFEADRLLDVGGDDIIIVIDVRRYIERCLAAADWCLSRGASLIVLSDSPASPLCGRTPHRLVAATNGAGAFDSYVGLVLLADILTNLITAQDPARTRRRLELGETAWEQFRTFSGRPEPKSAAAL